MAMGAARIIAMTLMVALAGCGAAQEKAAKAAARYDYFYAKRNYYAARVEIRRALAQQDDVPEYWARLARVQLALGRMLDAYTAYQSVIDLDPKNKDAVQALAELAYVGNPMTTARSSPTRSWPTSRDRSGCCWSRDRSPPPDRIRPRRRLLRCRC